MLVWMLPLSVCGDIWTVDHGLDAVEPDAATARERLALCASGLE